MTMTAPSGAPTMVVPPAPPRRMNPRRRNPAMASLGVLLVVIGALGAWRYVGVAASGTHAYLAVYAQVPMGGVVTAADLQVVRITPAAGLLPIAASRMDEVVGTYAKVDLYPGTLLTTDELTHTASPAPDQALVGLKLAADQRPGRVLRTGEHVVLVLVPDASSTVTPTPGVALPTWQATVAGIYDVQTDGSQVVDVFVANADLAAVATAADADRIAAVLVAGA
jgi:hypothetical protein